MHIDGWTLLLEGINFLILAWLLQRFLYKPVVRLLERRQKEVDEALEKGVQAEKQAEQSEKAWDAKIAEVAAERDRLVEQGRAQVSAEREQVLAEARTEAEGIVGAAHGQIGDERNEALSDLRAQAAELAVALARGLLAQLGPRAVTEALLERVGEHLDALAPDALETLRRDARGRPARLITAAPLDAEAAAPAVRAIGERLGTAIETEVDPALLGGIELSLPHSVLRFSWRDALGTVEQELREHAVA